MVIGKGNQDTNKLISAVKNRTDRTVIAKEELFLSELSILKTDRNFSDFFGFFDYLRNVATDVGGHIKKADDLYELYSVMTFFDEQVEKGTTKNMEVKFNKEKSKLLLMVDGEEILHQVSYDDVSGKIGHRTDYISTKNKLVFEAKNYANLDSVSKFIRDVYCYCLFCDKKNGPKYNGVLLIRNKPKNMKDRESVKILLDKNIDIWKVS